MEIIGLYRKINHLNLRPNFITVIAKDSQLYQSPPTTISIDMIHDLKSVLSNNEIETEIINLILSSYINTDYTIMNQEDIIIASEQIPNLKTQIRQNRIEEILK